MTWMTTFRFKSQRFGELKYILGQPQELAQALAKMSAAATFINAVVSVILVAIIYNAVRPVLIKSHLITITNNKNQVA